MRLISIHPGRFRTVGLLICLACILLLPGAGEPPAFTVRSVGGNPEMILLGEEHWKDPWAPDLNNPGKRLPLDPDNRIDIMILADGYRNDEREIFNRDIADWYRRFITLHPFREMRGMFRVRSFWTPGNDHASAARKSFFQIGIDSGAVSPKVSPGMAASIFRVLDGTDFNRKLFPDNRYRCAYLAILVKPCRGTGCGIGGRPLFIVAPDGKRSIAASLGDDALHEFGHSFVGLSDEYIDGAGVAAKPRIDDQFPFLNKHHQVTPGNLSYTARKQLLPWRHLAPGGAYNPDRTSLIGLLWIGGGGEGGEFGVWHSEPTCLMNGGHENWNFEKTKRGAFLRDTGRLCFWCEELTAAYIWYLAGFLGATHDGVELWKNWLKVQPGYYRSGRMAERIPRQNSLYLKAGLDRSPLHVDPTDMVPADPAFLTGVRIQNASTGCFLFEKNGRVLCGDGVNLNDIWMIEGDVNGFVRIKNKRTGHYIHQEDNSTRIECTDIHAGAWSSHWVFTKNANGNGSFWSRWTNMVIASQGSGAAVPVKDDPVYPKRGQWIVGEAK